MCSPNRGQPAAKPQRPSPRSSPAHPVGHGRARILLGRDRTIYVASLDNRLYALEPDGTLKWSFALSVLKQQFEIQKVIERQHGGHRNADVLPAPVVEVEPNTPVGVLG